MIYNIMKDEFGDLICSSIGKMNNFDPLSEIFSGYDYKFVAIGGR